MDKLDAASRSRVMASVRSTGNRSTELRFRGQLVRQGIKGWKVQSRELCGRPDFFFPKQKIAIFVDSCYWHGCPKHVRHPSSRRSYWRAKIGGNVARDKRVTRTLRAQGWRVLRVWEHQLADSSTTMSKLKAVLKQRA